MPKQIPHNIDHAETEQAKEDRLQVFPQQVFVYQFHGPHFCRNTGDLQMYAFCEIKSAFYGLYRGLYIDDLLAESWGMLSPSNVLGNGGQLQITDTNNNAAVRFYRLDVKLQ